MATDLTRRFKWDIFFSTRTKIILFHTFSVVVIVFVTAGLVEYIERISLLAVIDSLHSVIGGGATEADAFEEARAQTRNAKYFVFGAIIVAALSTGFFATRLALRPVRDSLILQKRFIASVAHELRTPLAILKTQNEVAKLDIDPAAPIAHVLEENVEEIDHITEILNNLLLFNRVDTLESISFDNVDLHEVVGSVVKRLIPLSERKGIVLRSDIALVPSVYGNATGLEQAVFNITKNGLNYTPRGGEVLIECVGITDRDVSLSISDTGSGIPKKDLPHVFEPFYRADKSRSTARGTGLGLALVFEIMKLHNGKIRVESSEGEGTRFVLSIPRQQSVALTGLMPLENGVSYDFSSRKDA